MAGASRDKSGAGRPPWSPGTTNAQCRSNPKFRRVRLAVSGSDGPKREKRSRGIGTRTPNGAWAVRRGRVSINMALLPELGMADFAAV
jgi:hypothetical protein